MARIVCYIHSLAGGGAERVWAVVASGLARRGHDVTFVVETEDNASRAYLDPGIPLRQLPSGSHLLHVGDILRLWKELKPDVVLTAVTNANLKAAIAQLVSPIKPVLISSVHGATAGSTGILGRSGPLFFPAVARIADRVVYISEGLRRLTESRVLMPHGRSTVIYNPVFVPNAPVDPSECDRMYPRLQGRRIVLSVGRFNEVQKAQSDLLKAFARFGADNPDFDLALLGEGPSKPDLERLASQLAIEDRVHFLGYHREPWIFYARASLYAHTARHEGFGNVIVEALAYGLPVVSTDTLGPTEILAGGEYGYVVPRGDIAAIAGALQTAAHTPVDADRLRARAAVFAPERAIDAYEALIYELLARKASARTLSPSRTATSACAESESVPPPRH
jgi:glycosyltransferase involved in cell wall biosynthesis